jgi:H/ACA ribonucleoprotein complex subunit 4
MALYEKMTDKLQELLEGSFLVIDKPADWTSHDVVAFVRGCLKIRKVGHLGTLDPMVTGVLPLMVGRATKLSEQLMKKDKTYVGTMALHEPITEEELKKQIKKFIGTITQLPPVKSRVKRQERQRTVHDFKITKMHTKKAEFIVKTEAGTYIRKLIHDLGEKIGGAHMTALRRTQAGKFNEKQPEITTIPEFKKLISQWREGDSKKLEKIFIPINNLVSTQ